MAEDTCTRGSATRRTALESEQAPTPRKTFEADQPTPRLIVGGGGEAVSPKIRPPNKMEDRPDGGRFGPLVGP